MLPSNERSEDEFNSSTEYFWCLLGLIYESTVATPVLRKQMLAIFLLKAEYGISCIRTF